MDNFSESRLGGVHPGLAEKIRDMATMLDADGIVIRVTQGLRTWDQQQDLWQRGRDERGQVVDKAAVVTKAPAGYSWHNFGLAVDVVPDDTTLAGFQADWNTAHPAWAKIIAVGKSLGLVEGAEWRTFPDWPHFQLTGRFPATPTDEVRRIYKDLGMRGVWAEAFNPLTNNSEAADDAAGSL